MPTDQDSPGPGQWPTAPRQDGPRCWHGSVLATNPEWWRWELSAQEIAELRKAASGIGRLANAADTGQITPPDLPVVGPRLAQLSEELVKGRGFQLITGLPAEEMGPDELAAVFVTIGLYLGSPRSQNAAGDLLGHVRNVGLDLDDPAVRIYQTNQRQTFHTDSTDLVGLCCLEPAAEGGRSMVVSAATIYNRMLDEAPELAARLFDPVATDRRGEVPPGHDPWFTIPVLTWYRETLTVLYQRQYIDSAARFDDAPALDGQQIEALDLFDRLADDPDLHLAMDLEPGDIQFVYNHALLHDRTGFIDKPGAPRHLLRLWLSMPNDRELHPVFAQRYGSITIGDRGGIRV